MTFTCIWGDSKFVPAEPGDWARLDARLFDLETTLQLWLLAGESDQVFALGDGIE